MNTQIFWVLGGIVLIVLLVRAKKLGYFGGGSKGNSSVAGRIVGNLEPPPHDDRILARNRSLASRGIVLTGNDDVDNAATGGGAPDGGIFLLGPFEMDIAENGNITGFCQLFRHAEKYDIAGTMAPDGKVTGSWSGHGVVGGGMFGVVQGDSFTGRFQKWPGMEWIYGSMVGTYNKSA